MPEGDAGGPDDPTMTMKTQTILLAACLCLVGCDSLHYNQYVITNASPADRAIVKESVAKSAVNAGLVDKTASSMVPDVIVYYLEPVPNFPVSLGARMVDGAAVVDLSCFHPGVAKPPVFQTVELSLTATLNREFGTRLKTSPPSERIPLNK